MLTKLLLISFLSFLRPADTTAFKSSDATYCVYTFEETPAGKHHPTQRYYWMIRADSIAPGKFALYPLLIDDFSKSDLELCKGTKPVNIWTFNSNSNFDFDNTYLAGIKELHDLLAHERRKIQTIDKPSLTLDKVDIYVTPITGEFCACPLVAESSELIKYKGLVSLPVSRFEVDKSFWKSVYYARLIGLNYSGFHYINQPVNE